MVEDVVIGVVLTVELLELEDKLLENDIGVVDEVPFVVGSEELVDVCVVIVKLFLYSIICILAWRQYTRFFVF